MHLFKTYDEPGQDVAQRSDRHINPAGCGAWRGLDAPGKQPLKYLAAADWKFLLVLGEKS